MAIDFPSTGLVANTTTYTYNGRTWLWNGTGWQSTTTTYGPTGPTGPAGLAYYGINNTATSPYILALSDASKMVEINSASAATVTIPISTSVNYPIGTEIVILQTGAGQVTISGTGGVTLTSAAATSSAPKTRMQWSSISLVKRNTDVWVAVGDLI